MRVPSFTTEQIGHFMQAMHGMYDIVRLVDPGSCRVVLTLAEDGTQRPVPQDACPHCYEVWGRSDRCLNCSSYRAAISGRIQEKTELLNDSAYRIVSTPVLCIDADGTERNLCMEFVKLVDMHTARIEEEPAEGQERDYRSQNLREAVTTQLLAAAGDQTTQGVVCYDSEGACIFANASAFRMLGVDNDLLELERKLGDWGMPNYQQQAGRKWTKVIHGSKGDNVYELQYFELYDSAGSRLGSYLSIGDVTVYSENTAGELFREQHDPLTGIYNWEGFKERALNYLAKHDDRRHVLVRVNVRNFKLVNQLYGLERGNDVLLSVAMMCRNVAGRSGVYGRIISDHYMLLLDEEDYDEELLRKEAMHVVESFGDSLYKLHLQFGIYTLTDRREDLSIMCDRAKMALKSITDEHLVSFARYNHDLILNALYENEIISSFEEAIRKDQLHIFLQSQNDRHGNIFGAEALARWIHPEQGVIPPAKFIGVLENAGMIHELDRYIWEQTVRQLAAWKGTDKDGIRLSVNISPKDIQALDIEKTFIELVRRYDILPSRLNLEITESAVMANPEYCIELVGALQRAGFAVEIDDFGSGYSSLNMLKDIRANILKIDRAFLQTLEQEKRAEIILTHIINMAHDLEMGVITEGVETERQLKMLSDLGCNMFQGYYFSKPIPVKEFETKYF